jgi:adenylate kinase family enzyme
MVGDTHLKQADTIVWLDLPRRIVMTRVIWRTIRRVLTREELWNGNKEPWTNLYHWDPELNVIRWTWVTHPERREKYRRASSDGSWAHAEVVRLRSPEAVENFLGSTAAS